MYRLETFAVIGNVEPHELFAIVHLVYECGKIMMVKALRKNVRMKKKGLLLLSLSPVLAFGQDLIVKKDGDVIQAKVLKVSAIEVEYKKWSNQNGPLYSIGVGSILAINYENGEKETFANTYANVTQVVVDKNTLAMQIEMPVNPDDNNANLLDLYNNQIVVSKKPNPKDKLAEWIVPVWGISNNSVLSDENVTVRFEKLYKNKNVKTRYVLGYRVQVQNKTDKNIYIDLVNSFKVDDKGMSTPYFSNKIFTSNVKSGSGSSFNVGAVMGALGVGGVVGTLANGMNVGGGKEVGTSVTEDQERILVIPPHATASLPLEKKVDGNEVKEIPEIFTFHDLPDKGLPVKVEEFKVLYDENESFAKNRRIITYSTTPDFNTYFRVNIEVYVRAALGESKVRFYNDYYLTATNWDYLLIASDFGVRNNEKLVAP